jgi:molybdenum cofactor cytidylyltransferase
MGTQKLLLPVGGKPVIARVVDALIDSPLERVLVVVGANSRLLRAALADHDVTFVENDDPASQMLDSVRYGLLALPPECQTVLVALGDQPQLQSGLVSQLLHEHRSTGGGIVVPTYQGRRGHPLLFSIGYRDEILSRHDDNGLRGLLEGHIGEVHEVDVESSAVLEDLDLPADYARLTESLVGIQ